MANNKETLQLFEDFIEVYAEDYYNGVRSLSDDFSIENHPEIETSVMIISEKMGYKFSFLLDAIKAFQLMYPEHDIPKPLYDA